MSETIIETYKDILMHENMPNGKRKTLEAAIFLFSKNGFSATSTSQLAEQAGVSQATIFKYFKTKDDLLIAIVLPIMPRLFQDFFPNLKEIKNLKDAIHFIVIDRFQFFSANAPILKILLQEIAINPILREKFQKRLMSQDIGKEIEKYIHQLKENNLNFDDSLSTTEIIRYILGPLYTYFTQRFILQLDSPNQSRDLVLVERQILKALIKDNKKKL
ncbi:hypothetical protein HMPREF9318_01431 [Streptococcus urinalis FB127-CNA-2]|uniref:Transcriptional regulator, TetR family n=1 Tax=Streptococcus urinalis 2285-97 TaxID=764291 RepID=G5KD89_9STRE|nr:TetR/AcrR family transcriptional regulator [Streptococcus urinalis]EHJ56944.1 transcriptional regulator, TetR family [Streptococcus urinalis 2285-97]EKS19355.1 hypothetical protein HMPREF9318_01431 [Streptococcus urinalis FB127-CNA-2]VEF31485.1 transcriptional regulator [Streptococcus urinalis]